jgi:uncharacterized protein involved in outer membrane biogenesis
MLSKIKTLFISLPAKIIAGLIIFYFLFTYFAVNPLAKKIVPWVAQKNLASIASVGKVEFDPLRLKITIEHFKLSEENGAPLTSVDKLVVDLEANGLFDWAWKFKDISITAPHANIAISPKGKFNWADLIAKLNEDKTPANETIPRVVVAHFAMMRGNIEYQDANRPTPFKAELAPLDFELDGFSTLPKDRGNYLLAAKLANQGGTLKWKGNMGVNPVASKGSIAIENIQVAKLLQIVKSDTLPFKASSGDIQTNFNYDFSLPKDQPKVTLRNINVALNNVTGALVDAGNVSLKQATITAPTLTYSAQNKPELQLQNIAFKLDELSLQQGQDTRAAMKQAIATLPKLGIAIQSDKPMQLQDLNVKLTELGLSKGKESLLTLPEIDIKQISFNLAENRATIAQILLPQGVVNAARDKTGNINWQQAFATSNTQSNTVTAATASSAAVNAEPAPQKPEASFSVDIADIQLQHWKLAFQDAGFLHPIQTSVADFNLGFALTTKNNNVEINRLESSSTGITAKSALSNKPVATLAKLNLKQADINLEKRNVNVQAIVLSGLKTELIKEANKPFNWQTILEPAAGAKSNGAAASNKKPDWALMLKKLALDNASVHIEDRSLSAPVVLDVEKFVFELHDATLDLTRQLPIKAGFQVKQGGSFSTQGKLTPAPLKADIDIKLAEFSFKPFAPYLNQFALLKLNNGAGNVNGKLSLNNDKAISLTFNGGFSVDKLALIEEANDAPFLAWDKLSSDSLALSLGPNRVHMATLNIEKAAGKFIINADKSTNIAKILRSTANTNAPATNPEPVPDNATDITQTPATKAIAEVTQVAKEATSTEMAQAVLTGAAAGTTTKVVETAPIIDTAADLFPVTIETVRIDNAELEFADLSLTPQFGTQIHTLTGVINSVSTNPNTTAQVELDGKVDDYGSASVRGSVQPFKATNFTDLKLAFKNLEMNRLTPYSGKFAGRRIDSGKLSVELEYKIKQRQLAGENKFVINKLKLGEKIDSKEAANLPLDLAIAILEDSDGVIDLDLPISGSLDDPKFSYGSIVWKAIRNVLGKIVTAPFRALGKLFGGNGDKLEAISFDAGSAIVAPPEQEKLKSVSLALSKRQGLALGVIPSYDAAIDTRALQESTLRKQVAEELDIKLAEGQQAGPIDLSNPKTQKAIDNLHDTLTKKGLLKKLASKFNKPEAGYYEKAQEKLTASIEVTEADLQTLAKSRGESVQKALTAAGIAPDRVHVESPVSNKASDKAKTVDTKLTINVNSNKDKPAEQPSNEPAAQPAEPIKTN